MLAETCRARRELLQEVIMNNIHSLQETELFVCVSVCVSPSLLHLSLSLWPSNHTTKQIQVLPTRIFFWPNFPPTTTTTPPCPQYLYISS